MGRRNASVGALALTLGIGAAVAGGAGLAHAEGPTTSNSGPASSSAPKAESSSATSSNATKTKLRSPSLRKTGRDPGPSKATVDPGSPSRSRHARAADDAAGATSSTRVRKGPKGSDRPSDPGARPAAKAAIVRDAVQPPTADTTRQLPPTPPPASPRLATPVATVVSGVLNALGFAPSASTGDAPVAPMPMVLGALQLVSREIDHLLARRPSPTTKLSSAVTTAVDPPAPADEVQTDYGRIGKWMLKSNGQISNYGGQLYDGKTLLEPINVIIVDPASKTKAAATRKLNAAMFWSGFPAQPIHSGGFRGTIDEMTYGQYPKGFLQGYSDNSFLLTNDHGRIFGPDPIGTTGGYVWSGSFNTESFGTYESRPAHLYVSSNMARTALAMKLVLSGRATFVTMVPLDNAYDTTTTTTGDHDGMAVVLQLT